MTPPPFHNGGEQCVHGLATTTMLFIVYRLVRAHAVPALCSCTYDTSLLHFSKTMENDEKRMRNSGVMVLYIDSSLYWLSKLIAHPSKSCSSKSIKDIIPRCLFFIHECMRSFIVLISCPWSYWLIWTRQPSRGDWKSIISHNQ